MTYRHLPKDLSDALEAAFVKDTLHLFEGYGIVGERWGHVYNVALKYFQDPATKNKVGSILGEIVSASEEIALTASEYESKIYGEDVWDIEEAETVQDSIRDMIDSLFDKVQASEHEWRIWDSETKGGKIPHPYYENKQGGKMKRKKMMFENDFESILTPSDPKENAFLDIPDYLDDAMEKLPQTMRAIRDFCEEFSFTEESADKCEELIGILEDAETLKINYDDDDYIETIDFEQYRQQYSAIRQELLASTTEQPIIANDDITQPIVANDDIAFLALKLPDDLQLAQRDAENLLTSLESIRSRYEEWFEMYSYEVSTRIAELLRNLSRLLWIYGQRYDTQDGEDQREFYRTYERVWESMVRELKQLIAPVTPIREAKRPLSDFEWLRKRGYVL